MQPFVAFAGTEGVTLVLPVAQPGKRIKIAGPLPAMVQTKYCIELEMESQSHGCGRLTSKLVTSC